MKNMGMNRMKKMSARPKGWIPSLSGLVLASMTAGSIPAVAQVKTVNLQAVQASRVIRGETITFWTFDDTSTALIGRVSPGPVIGVGANQGLEIILVNNLTLPPGATELPTSIIIPGQPMPEVFDGATSLGKGVVRTGDGRVRSLTQETPLGQTRRYVWSTATGNQLEAGTYLYQSGTHMTVQVQMGLYGAVQKNTSANTPYPNYTFGAQTTWVYSEVDAGLHAAVVDGTYGTSAFPTTMDYLPNYFLINGNLQNNLANALKTVDVTNNPLGDPLLIRMLNAGLNTHVPTFLNTHVQIIAEDGKPYPFAKDQYSLQLYAGKTKDVLMDIPANGTYSVFDRRLFRTGGSTADGGISGGMAGRIIFN